MQTLIKVNYYFPWQPFVCYRLNLTHQNLQVIHWITIATDGCLLKISFTLRLATIRNLSKIKCGSYQCMKWFHFHRVECMCSWQMPLLTNQPFSWQLFLFFYVSLQLDSTIRILRWHSRLELTGQRFSVLKKLS